MEKVVHIRRIRKIMKSTARINLENDIAAFDKTWKGKMDNRTCLELLFKCHPLYRIDHARKLKETGELTEEEYSKIVTKNSYVKPTIEGDWK